MSEDAAGLVMALSWTIALGASWWMMRRDIEEGR